MDRQGLKTLLTVEQIGCKLKTVDPYDTVLPIHDQLTIQVQRSANNSFAQCAISNGTSLLASMSRVTPPKMVSRRRECP